MIKTVAFESFNSLAACVFTAFFKSWVFDSCSAKTCVLELRTLLYSILIVRIIYSLTNVLSTWIEGNYRYFSNTILVYFIGIGNKPDVSSNVTGGVSGDKQGKASGKSKGKGGKEDSDEDQQFMMEIFRKEYPGTFQSGVNIFMQFAFIILFSVVNPMLCVVSFIENLIRLRLEGYELCAIYRRPHVEMAEDAGYWSQIMPGIIYVGIYMNTALFTHSYPDFIEFSASTKLIILFAATQSIFLLVLWLQSLLPSVPEYIQTIIKRHEYVCDKYVKGFQDLDEDTVKPDLNTEIDNDEENLAMKGHVEDVIDIDSVNLYDLRKGLKISDEDFSLMESLENQRRDLQRELSINKDRLVELYKSEIFNESAGVGETKYGLPLGRLFVNLIEIKNFYCQENELMFQQMNGQRNFEFKLRIDLKNRKSGALAPITVPLMPSVTDSRSYNAADVISLSQAMGPFAPIRTIDADVYFHIIHINTTDNTVLTLASAHVSLRELQDQLSHDLILYFKLPDFNNQMKTSKSALYVNCIFQYSKIVPIRNNVLIIQDKLQSIEQQLVKLKSGIK